jgi:predicted phosphodiesterase
VALFVVIGLFVNHDFVATANENFSLVLFPDTQYEVQSHHDMWESMPPWVVANQLKLNIKAVIGLGDVTDTDTTEEYVEAVKGWDVIKSSGLIYMPTRGNHDSSEALWNQYFGPKYFAGKPWFSGSDGNSTSCYYVKFVEGSQKYLVLAVGYDPNTQQIAWAQSALNANNDSKVVVVAHSYLNVTEFTPQGTTLWNGLIKQNKNIFLVVCGHIHTPYTSYVVSSGNNVNELRADYQDYNYGNGYMEILTFQPSKSRIQTTAFSAYNNKTDSTGSYVMPL